MVVKWEVTNVANVKKISFETRKYKILKYIRIPNLLKYKKIKIIYEKIKRNINII
jgi:hypothetical protein